MKKRQNNIVDRLIAFNSRIALLLLSFLKKVFFNPFSSFAKKHSLYFKLLRLDKPAGFLLLMLPVLWTVTVAAKDLSQVFIYCLFFAVGSIIMRSAGCIINDIIDRKIDKVVKRTKDRPLASGELSIKKAISILVLLLVVGLLMLLCLPLQAVKIGLISIVFIVIYPFVKRKSYFPQIFLGITFNIGILIAWVTFKYTVSFTPALLYLTAIIWTIAYDTIYAYQDIKDDKKVGIKSMALLLGSKGNKVIWNLYSATMILFLIIALNTYMNIYFYILFGCAAYMIHLQIETIDLKDTKDCLKKFNSNVWFGLIIFLAFIVGRFL